MRFSVSRDFTSEYCFFKPNFEYSIYRTCNLVQNLFLVYVLLLFAIVVFVVSWFLKDASPMKYRLQKGCGLIFTLAFQPIMLNASITIKEENESNDWERNALGFSYIFIFFYAFYFMNSLKYARTVFSEEDYPEMRYKKLAFFGIETRNDTGACILYAFFWYAEKLMHVFIVLLMDYDPNSQVAVIITMNVLHIGMLLQSRPFIKQSANVFALVNLIFLLLESIVLVFMLPNTSKDAYENNISNLTFISLFFL